MGELKGRVFEVRVFSLTIVTSVIECYLYTLDFTSLRIHRFYFNFNVLAVTLKPKFSLIVVTDLVSSKDWIPI